MTFMVWVVASVVALVVGPGLFFFWDNNMVAALEMREERTDWPCWIGILIWAAGVWGLIIAFFGVVKAVFIGD